MHLAFYRSIKDKCRVFAGTFRDGISTRGDTVSEYPVLGDFNNPADVIVSYRVRRKEIFDHAKANHIPLLYFDKGYTRTADWQRIAYDGTEPGGSLGLYTLPEDRRIAQGWHPKPWRKRGDHILLASSNEVEHAWRGLPSPQVYAAQAVGEIQRHTDRPIVHRCKPNQSPMFCVDGTVPSRQGNLEDDLKDAHAVVTVGSSVALWALLAGIPTVVLGDALSVGISSRDLHEIENPKLAPDLDVIEVLNDLAYHQWSVEEFKSGEAWSHIRTMFEN